MATKKPATKKVATKATATKKTATKRPAVKKERNGNLAKFNVSLDGQHLQAEIEGSAENLTKALTSVLNDSPELKMVFKLALLMA